MVAPEQGSFTGSGPPPAIIQSPSQLPFTEPPSFTKQYVANEQLLDEQQHFGDQQSSMQQPSVEQPLADSISEQQASIERPPPTDPLFHFGQSHVSAFDPTLSFNTATHDDLYAQMNSLAQQSLPEQANVDQGLELPTKRQRTAPPAADSQVTGAADADDALDSALE